MTLETIILAFSGTVFVLLIALLKWVGTRLYSRLDELTTMLDTKLTILNGSLSNIERDLRQELIQLDRRVAFIEGAGGQDGKQKPK